MNEWISVKERFPEECRFVLVIGNGRPNENTELIGAYELAEYSAGDGWIFEMWPEWEVAEVTHWMPLPPPPGEETSDE